MTAFNINYLIVVSLSYPPSTYCVFHQLPQYPSSSCLCLLDHCFCDNWTTFCHSLINHVFLH
nr:MAG TPA: hypothetical protein [Caudoviricetes sp.]DAY74134.1 MAG TPA: hypothetical protein [Caudoviricetes sp.]